MKAPTSALWSGNAAELAYTCLSISATTFIRHFHRNASPRHRALGRTATRLTSPTCDPADTGSSSRVLEETRSRAAFLLQRPNSPTSWRRRDSFRSPKAFLLGHWRCRCLWSIWLLKPYANFCRFPVPRTRGPRFHGCGLNSSGGIEKRSKDTSGAEPLSSPVVLASEPTSPH